MNRRTRQDRDAFTLVELLVVIGVVAVLLAMLMPALNAARQQAATIQCASNLRQLGMAIIQYSDQFKGNLPPAFTPHAPDPWTDWVTVLITARLINVQVNQQFGTVTTTKNWNNVMVCPSGTNLMQTGTPWTKQSQTGAGWCDHFDATGGKNYHYTGWYCLNSMSANGVALGTYPFNSVPLLDSAGTTITSTQTLKFSRLRPSSSVPMVFDGAQYIHAGMDTRINLRHQNARICNIVFADGHVSGLRGDELPGGMKGTAATLELGDPVKLNLRNPNVHWMLTQ